MSHDVLIVPGYTSQKEKGRCCNLIKMTHDFKAVNIDPLFRPFRIKGEEKGEVWNQIMLHHIHLGPITENAWEQL